MCSVSTQVHKHTFGPIITSMMGRSTFSIMHLPCHLSKLAQHFPLILNKQPCMSSSPMHFVR